MTSHSTSIAHATSAATIRACTARAAAIAVLATILFLPVTVGHTAADALYKEGLLVWESPVMDLSAEGESGRAEAFLDRAVDRYAAAVRFAPHEPRYRIRIGFAEDTRAVLLDERLARALAQAGLSAAEDEYDPVLLDGYANELAERRDAAFAAAMARFDEASLRAGWRRAALHGDGARPSRPATTGEAPQDRPALAASVPGSPAPILAQARAYRLWGDLTREPTRRTHRLASAAAAYAYAVISAPTWPEVHNEVAIVALLADRTDTAIVEARASIALDPYYNAPWKTLALALTERGREDDAAATVDAWARYFEDPRNAGDVDAIRGHLGSLLRLGSHEEAVQIALDLVALTPGDARAHADLATAYDGAGDRDRALAAARAASALAPGDPRIATLLEGLEGR